MSKSTKQGESVKRNVRHFKHMANASDTKTLKVLANKWKNDGRASWWVLIETLSAANDLYLDLSSEYERAFLSEKCMVEELVLIEILNTLAEMGSINKHLWLVHQVVWSDNLLDWVKGTWSTRSPNNLPPSRPFFDDCPECEEPEIETPTQGKQASEEAIELCKFFYETISKYPWSQVDCNSYEKDGREKLHSHNAMQYIMDHHKQTPEQIKKVILFSARADGWWAQNSPISRVVSLKYKYDKLFKQANKTQIQTPTTRAF